MGSFVRATGFEEGSVLKKGPRGWVGFKGRGARRLDGEGGGEEEGVLTGEGLQLRLCVWNVTVGRAVGRQRDSTGPTTRDQCYALRGIDI